MKRILMLLCAFVLLGTASCEKEEIGNTMTDPRDSQTYKTIKIGDQVWMAENLNYPIGRHVINGIEWSRLDYAQKAWCYYSNENGMREKYGLLYNFFAAKHACPDGWHLPLKEEFEELLLNYGTENSFVYDVLIYGGSSGFSALHGGYRNNDGKFFSEGEAGNWWSGSSFIDSYERESFWLFNLYSEGKQSRVVNVTLGTGYSVRCVQD